jgi:Putative archaeal flagellar protein F
MGFSVSASTAVIFAGLFLALGMFYPAMANSYERVQAADANQADRALEQANTDIRLDDTTINNVPSGDNQVDITLTNNGSTSLTVSETDLLVNGTYIQRSELDTEVDGNSTTNLWLPGETLIITYETSGTVDRVRVVTEHGVAVSEDI